MAVITKDYIKTLNPGSARFGEPGELVVQRMRFELLADASYNTGGFDVTLDEMVVVEAASVTREGALSETSANNYRPLIHSIQVDDSGNKVKIQLMNPQTGLETDNNTDLSGNKFVLDAEGY